MPPIDDLTLLSEAASIAEQLLLDRFKALKACPGGARSSYLDEGLAQLTRLTVIRKVLIKLHRLPSVSVPSVPSVVENPPVPAPVPDPEIRLPQSTIDRNPTLPELPDLPTIPLEEIALTLSEITVQLKSQSSLPTTQSSVLGAQSSSSQPSSSQDSAPSTQDSCSFLPEVPLDPRCVALGIHPMVDTRGFPDNHPFFDPDLFDPVKVRARMIQEFGEDWDKPRKPG